MKQNLLSVMNAVLLMVSVGLFLYVYFKEQKSKKSQARLIESLSGTAHINWFRIKLSRPKFFHRRFKFLGHEGRAILINSPDTLRLVAELGSGEVVDKSYSKNDLNLQWIGNPAVSSANMHWISIGKDHDLVMVTADTGLIIARSREATADMCRMIAPSFKLPVNAKADFALEKNPASLLLIAAFFLLLAYALVDGLILSHHELIKLGNIGLLLPVLLLAAIPIYFQLVRSKVPSRESLALSMLLVVALEISAIPIMQRADRLLASEAAHSYDYRLEEDANLTPLEKDPPKLKFAQAKEYWSQFEVGSIHQFDLVHGPLGLWQLDHSTLDPKFLAYYEKQDDHK